MGLVLFFIFFFKSQANAELSIIGTRRMTSLPGHTYGGTPDMMERIDVGVNGRIGEQVVQIFNKVKMSFSFS